jgi:hypothetical protein
MQSFSFLLEFVEEGIEGAGDILGLEVEVEVLLGLGQGIRQSCNLIYCDAKRWDELADWELLDIVLDAVGCTACDAKGLLEEFLFTHCYLSTLALYHALRGSPGDSYLTCDSVDLSALSRQVHNCPVLGS